MGYYDGGVNIANTKMKQKTYDIIYFTILIFTLIVFTTQTIYLTNNADHQECYWIFCTYTIYHNTFGLENYVCVPLDIQNTNETIKFI